MELTKQNNYDFLESLINAKAAILNSSSMKSKQSEDELRIAAFAFIRDSKLIFNENELKMS